MVRKPHIARYIPSPATTPALATDEATSRVPVCREGTSLAVGTSNVRAAFRPVLEVIALSSLDPFSVRLGCAQACLKETQRDEKRGDLNHCDLLLSTKWVTKKKCLLSTPQGEPRVAFIHQTEVAICLSIYPPSLPLPKISMIKRLFSTTTSRVCPTTSTSTGSLSSESNINNKLCSTGSCYATLQGGF